MEDDTGRRMKTIFEDDPFIDEIDKMNWIQEKLEALRLKSHFDWDGNQLKRLRQIYIAKDKRFNI